MHPLHPRERVVVGAPDGHGAVAREAGHDDPMYFSRQFTRVHGMNPSTYRERPHGN